MNILREGENFGMIYCSKNGEVCLGMEIHVGDTVKLKKQHPCGSKEWEVLREGADFRLKCCGCGHQIMIARRLLEKSVKEVKS